MRKKSAQGFVFLVVLVFMQLFSLLSLYGLLRASSAVKMNQHLWERDKDLFAAQDVLRELENKFLQGNLSCRVPPIPAAILRRQAVSWWHNHACRAHQKGSWYYYFVETLGKDACAAVNIKTKLLVPEYYRITLFALSERIKNAKMILQTTVVKASDELAVCQGNKHRVGLGRQMWREI